MTRNDIIGLYFFMLIFIHYGYSINPIREYKMTPEQFNLEFEEVKIKTSDGAELNTWVMKTSVEKKSNFTFIIAGSDAGNMGFSLPYAMHLLNNGYDVITFDYRGFGESSDFSFNPNNLYHDEYIKDFTTVVNWSRKELKSENIGVLAFSMGTLISTVGYRNANYEILVGEGFLNCPKKVVKRIEKIKNKKIKIPKSAKSACKRMMKIEIPILLFASKKDEITTLKDSQRVVEQKQNRELVTFDGEHLRGASTLGLNSYMAEINKIIEKAAANKG